MSGNYIRKTVKEKILKRAKERCEYCQSFMNISSHTFHIDHVIPISKGGDNHLNNLCLSCGGCNSRKSNRTLVKDTISGVEVPLFNPRVHSWDEHFAWSDNFLEILGLTAIGRATVLALEMNRIGLRNLRRLTISSGEHPPN